MTNNKLTLTEQYKDPTGYTNRVALLDFAEPPFNMWQWAAEHYSFENSKNILEVGCGTGDFWKYAATQLRPEHHIILTDLSEGMLQTTQKTLQELNSPCPIKFQIADVEHLDFKDSSFDCVIAHLMLYHTHSPMQALNEINRVLKDNGWVGILTFSDVTNNEIYVTANRVDPRIPAYPYIISPFSESVADQMLPQIFTRINKIQHTVNVKIPRADPMVNNIKTHFITQDFNLTADFFERYQQEIQKIIDKQGSINMSYDYIFYVCFKN